MMQKSFFIKRIRALNQRLTALTHCDRGVAGVEFALVFPVCLIVFFAVTEICYYQMVNRRAELALEYTVNFMSRDDDDTMSVDEVMIIEDIWQIVNVSSYNNTGKYAQAFASIEFVKTPTDCVGSACNYEAVTKWTYLANRGVTAPKRRTCVQSVAAENEELNETLLSEEVVGRSSIVVADYTYRHKPILDLGFINGHERYITATRQTRGGRTLNMTGDAALYQLC